MRNAHLLGTIIALMVFPALGFGQTPIVTVDTAALGGTGGEEIAFDKDNPAHQTVQFDVLLSTDQGLDAIQFVIAINPVGNTWGDSSLWMTSANPWSMPPAFSHPPISAGFNYLVGAPPPAPVVNEYYGCIGSTWRGVIPEPDPGYPLTPLDQIPCPELYLKVVGASTNVGNDMVVAHYEIQPVNRDTIPNGVYTIDITADVMGLGAVWVKVVQSGPLTGQKAYIHVIPEPMSLLLLLAGLPFLRRCRN